jgi:hypothetical protein
MTDIAPWWIWITSWILILLGFGIFGILVYAVIKDDEDLEDLD